MPNASPAITDSPAPKSLAVPDTGDSAPDFTAPATAGEGCKDGQFTLSRQRGKHVVLYFYPKDGTPGCTTESLQFRDQMPAFTAANTIVVGLSRDSIRSHERFQSKLELPFSLISDEDEAVCNAFQVIKQKKMYGRDVRGIERSTFLIDAEGTVRHVWRGVKVANHVDDVLAAVQAL